MDKLREIVRRGLVFVGVRHPAKGIKVTQNRKAEVLLSYKTPLLRVFIETGTHQGGMIEALKNHFEEIHSIEFDEELCQAAKEKFKHDQRIHIYCGDSAKEIDTVVQKIKQPSLFWLDAHGSGTITFENSPIEKELKTIFNHFIKRHVILIDDARHFTLSDIRTIERMARVNGYHCAVDEGLFRLTPKGE